MLTQNELDKGMLRIIFLNSGNKKFYKHDNIVGIVQDSCSFHQWLFYTFDDNSAKMV